MASSQINSTSLESLDKEQMKTVNNDSDKPFRICCANVFYHNILVFRLSNVV